MKFLDFVGFIETKNIIYQYSSIVMTANNTVSIVRAMAMQGDVPQCNSYSEYGVQHYRTDLDQGISRCIAVALRAIDTSAIPLSQHFYITFTIVLQRIIG